MHRLGAMDGGIGPVWPEARLAEPGDVLVVNAQGLLAHAVLGELMALAGLCRGRAGVVVDGAILDATALAELRFPVFARGACASGPRKDGTGEIGFPIACGGVVCAPGDLVLADGDGVVVIPAADAEPVLAQAALINAWEDERRTALTDERPADRAGAR